MPDAAYYRSWRAAHPAYRDRQKQLRRERRRRTGRGDRSAEYARRRSRAIPPVPGLHLGHDLFELARRIEAGLYAQHRLDSGSTAAGGRLSPARKRDLAVVVRATEPIVVERVLAQTGSEQRGMSLAVGIPSPEGRRVPVDPVDADDDAGVTLSSPVAVHSPLLGAQVDLCPGAALQLRLDASYEHGVLVDGGPLCVDGEQVERSELAYLARGRDGMALRAGEHGARVILLGGEPFGRDIVMWWNFVGRSHDEIVAYRRAWEQRDDQFPPVVERGERVMEAPALPTVTLRPRPPRQQARETGR